MDFDNFEISLGIRKNGKLVNIKKEEKINIKSMKIKENIIKTDEKELEKQDFDNLSINNEVINTNILGKEISVQKHKQNVEKFNKSIELTKENQKYDDFKLNFDYKNLDNKNFIFLNIKTQEDSDIKTYITNSSISKSDRHMFDKLSNCYKSIKKIANFLDYSLILYNNDELILEKLEGTKKKTLYLLCINDNIYPLKQRPLRSIELIPKLNNKINGYKKRDIERNDRYVLFEDLNKYNNHFIKYKNIGNFKYKYLINEVNNKLVKELTENDINILTYLIENFGLHFYLIENYLKINKNDFNIDFVTQNKDCFIPDFSQFDFELLKNGYVSDNQYNYYYTNDQLRISIYGSNIEEVIEKCSNKDVSINRNEIRKIVYHVKLSEIKDDIDIECIKKIYEEKDYINYTRNKDTGLIIATKKINLDNLITADYLINLYENEQINYCKLCKCNLDWENISIDAINPMKGHTINNIQLLCNKCNTYKNTRFTGNYNLKPYFYDINTLDIKKLVEIMKDHDLEISDDACKMKKQLINYLKTI